MIQLFVAEWRKLIRHKVLVVSFLLLFVINGALAFWQSDQTVKQCDWNTEQALHLYREYHESPEAVREYYDDLAIYIAALKKAKRNDPGNTALSDERPGVYTETCEGDYALLTCLYSDVEASEKFEKMLRAAVKNAQTNYREAVFSGYTDADYACKFQRRMEFLYQNVLDTVKLPVSYRRGWNDYLNFEMTGIMALLMTAMVAAICFPMEKEYGTFPLVRVSMRGRQKTVWAKCGAVICGAIGSVVAFSAESFLVFGLTQGYSDASEPVQVLESMRTAWLTVSLGEFALVQLLLRIVAMVAFAFPVILLSVVFYQYVLTYASALILLGVHYLCNLGIGMQKGNILRYVNFFAFSNGVRSVERYYAVNINNHVCGYVTVGLFFFAALAVLCLAGGSFLYNVGFAGVRLRFLSGWLEKAKTMVRTVLHRKETRLPNAPACPKKQKKIRRYPMSVFLAEFHKMVVSSKLWIVVLGLLLLDVMYMQSEKGVVNTRGFRDSVYEMYMEKLEGPWTAEKEQLIEDFIDEQQGIIDNFDQVTQQYLDGKISASEYLDRQREYYQAPSKNKVLVSLMEHSDYLKDRQTKTGDTGYFFYDTGWKILFERESDIFLIVMVLIVVSIVFTQEYGANPFAKILTSTKNGRKTTYRKKYAVSVGYAALLSLLTQVVYIVIVSRIYHLPSADASLWSMEEYSAAGSGLTLHGYLAANIFVRMYAAVLLAVVVSSVSAITRRVIPTLAITAGVCFMPAMVGYAGFQTFAYVDYLRLSEAQPLLLRSFTAHLFGSDFGLLGIALLTLSVLACGLVWWAACRFGVKREGHRRVIAGKDCAR